jgi:hypothetical protein
LNKTRSTFFNSFKYNIFPHKTQTGTLRTIKEFGLSPRESKYLLHTRDLLKENKFNAKNIKCMLADKEIFKLSKNCKTHKENIKLILNQKDCKEQLKKQ